MGKEEWKPIAGYENYEVSNLGRIKSLKYGKEKIIKPKKERNGYLRVGLYKDRKRKMFQIHRLVAMAFIPNPNGFEQVNHKDENKVNNVVGNIEWCSPKYNVNFGTRSERVVVAMSKPVEASKYPDFREICLRFPSTQEADRNGYSSSCVSRCCNGRLNREGNNRYKNLYWRFAS